MLSEGLRDKLLSAVRARRDEIVAFAQRLVQIESVTGNEGPIQDFLAGELARMGLDVDRFEPDLAALEGHPGYIPVEGLNFAGRPNVVGISRGTGGGRSLLFNGHVDTIPLDPVEAWRHGPLSGVAEDGKVFGRGAADMKGGLAAMTMAVKILREVGIRPRGDLFLEYVVDEELTGYGTLACIQRGYRADAGISLETSDLCVQPACIGRLWFTVTLKGLTASISRHWEGVNAIDVGIRIVQAIHDLEQLRWSQLRHRLYPDHRSALPCVVCMFQAGSFPSAVPDLGVLRGSLGLMPQEDVKQVEQQVLAQIRSVAQQDPWLRDHPPVVEFKEVGADGAEILADHPIVRTVGAAFQAVTGSPATISGRTGGADTRYLIKYGQTPTVIFGPGLTSEMHAMNESLSVQNLLVAVQTLALVCVEWCGIDS